MLALMALIVVVSVARAVLTVATVTQDRSAKGTAWRLSKDDAFVSWWGVGRPLPRRKGDDYLLVMRDRSTARALGPILGTVVERQKALGVRIAEVVVPEDNDALLGGRTGATFTTAEGETASTRWAPVAISAANLTDTPLVRRAYDPVLTDAQLRALEARTTLSTATRHFRIGRASDARSGTWVLFAHESASGPREFILVPLEATSLGSDS